MRFTHEGANACAGANAFSAIELDGVDVFGDVLRFDGSGAFDGFGVVPINFSDSIF